MATQDELSERSLEVMSKLGIGRSPLIVRAVAVNPFLEGAVDPIPAFLKRRIVVAPS